MKGRFEVLLLTNTRQFGECLYGSVYHHRVRNHAGDEIEFTTKHHEKAASRRVARAELFLLRTDYQVGVMKSRRHGYGNGDFNRRAALITLPAGHAIWQMDRSRFETRWFYETIRRPLVWHRYHAHHETTTGYCAPPPDHLADGIEHYFDFGSTALGDEGKQLLDGEVFLNRLGLPGDERKVYTEDSRFDR